MHTLHFVFKTNETGRMGDRLMKTETKQKIISNEHTEKKLHAEHIEFGVDNRCLFNTMLFALSVSVTVFCLSRSPFFPISIFILFSVFLSCIHSSQWCKHTRSRARSRTHTPHNHTQTVCHDNTSTTKRHIQNTNNSMHAENLKPKINTVHKFLFAQMQVRI